MDRIPYEIFVSSSRSLHWLDGSPNTWTQRRLLGAKRYHAEVADKCRIILELIPSAFGMCWIAHYTALKDLSLLMTSEGDKFNLFFILAGEVEYRSQAQAATATQWQLNIVKASSINHELLIKQDKGLIALNLFIQTKMLKAYQHTFPILIKWLLSWQENKDTTALKHNVDDDGRLQSIVDAWWTAGLPSDEREIEMERFTFQAFDQLEMMLVAEKVASETELNSLRKVRARLLASLFHLQPPSLSELSQLAGMHFKRLERLYKAVFGMTMSQFFQEARMEAIYRRLCCTTKSLVDISLEFGYDEYSPFSAAVRRRFDQTPTEIRQSAKMEGC